jgi:signal transduction histidine kinase
VRDEGPGFDVNVVRAKGGLGLVSIRERARLVGGHAEISSAPGDGATILVRVPLEH